MGTMRLVVDAPDGGAPSEVDVQRLGELLGDTRNRLWLDIGDPGPAEVALLHRVFGFHELALEEVTRAHERPRCEAYGGYYFVVVYAAESAGDSFLARELNLFWSENYLVTIHRKTPAVLAVLDQARRRWEHHDGRQAYGVAALAYTLFESLVEGYFVVQDRVRERIEHIETEIFKGGDTAAADLFRLRKELLRVPRLLAPTSHVLAEVLRRERGIPEGLRPHFADVQDHAGPRPCRAGHLPRPARRGTRRSDVLRLQPARPYHAAADRGHRHHPGAELRRRHLRDELRADPAQPIGVRLRAGRGLPGMHGGVGVHPLADSGVALRPADTVARLSSY
jgi:CorA-like Mg2+ transporter protein